MGSDPGRDDAPVLRIDLKVVPGSSREEIAGFLGDVLRVRVRAPAERGKANAAVLSLLARTLGVAPSALRVVSGASSPRKTLEITGLASDAVRARLEDAIGSR
ncbi:MAG TPA: DUF167 domain-containing protein [Myxococcota bacterium]|nr:DUF167 domain-containing protein [Myxococcales bacterium]HPG27256.1 DUF167 domain-containing protein [Myxococcota bacterium]